jgi:small subunit ribosomal protein S6
MALYENVFILRQDLSPTQAEALCKTYMDLVHEHKGKVVSHEYWGLRQMAYIIKKNRRGHYFLFNLDASTEAVKEMERQMGLNENVLRFLTIRLDALPEGPSAIMRAKNREDSREDVREEFEPIAIEGGAYGV